MTKRAPSLGVIFLTIVIDLLGFGLVMPFLTLVARDAFHVGPGTAAMLGACYSAMQFLFMPVWGRLSDRIGRRPVMLMSIAASAVMMTLLGLALGFASSIGWLFLARAISGAATANIGTASAYIADITSPEERVKGMGMIGMAFGIGFIVGPGVGGLLAGYTLNGRHGPYACFAAALLSLINLVWAFTSLPESLPPERRTKLEKRSLSPLRLDVLGRTLSTRGIGQAAVTNFLIILAFSGLEITYSLFAADHFGLSKHQVGLMFVLMGFVGAGIQGGFMRRASGKYRETSLLYTGIGLMFAAYLVFVLAPRFGVPGLVVGSTLLALGNGFTQPSISAYISRLADPTRQGEALSANQSLSSLGRMFGPLAGGYLYGLNPIFPFLSCALLNFVAFAVASSMRRTQPMAQPSPQLSQM
jgi:DHA1 family tetracycline resistance protein-like MFS transporter